MVRCEDQNADDNDAVSDGSQWRFTATAGAAVKTNPLAATPAVNAYLDGVHHGAVMSRACYTRRTLSALRERNFDSTRG